MKNVKHINMVIDRVKSLVLERLISLFSGISPESAKININSHKYANGGFIMNEFKIRLVHLHHCRGISWDLIYTILKQDPQLQNLY